MPGAAALSVSLTRGPTVLEPLPSSHVVGPMPVLVSLWVCGFLKSTA